jgi:hypothetical protein
MKYRLPNTHQQEAEQADSRFIRCENDIRLSDEQIRQMNERIAARRAEFIERARNLKQARRTQRSEK